MRGKWELGNVIFDNEVVFGRGIKRIREWLVVEREIEWIVRFEVEVDLIGKWVKGVEGIKRWMNVVKNVFSVGRNEFVIVCGYF